MMFEDICTEKNQIWPLNKYNGTIQEIYFNASAGGGEEGNPKIKEYKNYVWSNTKKTFEWTRI